MRELVLSLPKNKKPYYLKIADALRHAITDKQLQPGEALPSTRHLARMLKVHRHTVMTALDELVAEGWVIAKARQSFYVSQTLPAQFFKSQATHELGAKANKNHWKIARSVDEFISPLLSVRKYNFQSGLPDLRLFPQKEFRLYMADALKQSPHKVMGYSDPKGYPLFIEAVKVYLRHVRAISDREIIVTNGSQEGIFLVAQLLLKPNDLVAVERLGYFPAWEAFRAAGAKLIPIDIDREGLDPDALEKQLKQKKIRMIYVTPLHQYPTTVTLTLARRLRLYELAYKYNVPILEDDYDHEFHYRSQPLAPLASHDPAEQVIYVSTFSKILYPSARLGFVAVPALLATHLKNYKRIVSRQSDIVLQHAVAHWMQEGGFERHLRRMRRVYEERRETILACVAKAEQEGVTVSCDAPDGGMAIWLNVGGNADYIAQAVARLGVHVVPESRYALATLRNPKHLRLGFANQNVQEIKSGMSIILSQVK